MRIIGITGTLGAGKGTIVEYLMKQHDFAHFSARGVLTEILNSKGLAVNRDTLREEANSMRLERGPAAVIEVLFERAQAAGRDAVIESVRTEGEVTALRRKSGVPFVLLAVDADQALRYRRVVGRGSSTDSVDFEKFKAQEKKEMESTKPHEQNLGRCMELADMRLTNDGSTAELHAATEAFLQAPPPPEERRHAEAVARGMPNSSCPVYYVDGSDYSLHQLGRERKRKMAGLGGMPAPHLLQDQFATALPWPREHRRKVVLKKVWGPDEERQLEEGEWELVERVVWVSNGV